ncbi:MAG TPA: hypothetical protein VF982_00295 [Anaerolineales bacterium]
MIEIKLPDGSIAQFPDGMPDADIERVLQQEFGGGQPAQPTAPAQPMRPGTPEYAAWAASEAQAGRGRSLPQVGQHTDTAPQNWQEPGALVPIQFPADAQTNGGWPRPAIPGVLSSAIDAFNLPGDVATGRERFDPRLGFSDQDPRMLDRAANAAGNMSPATVAPTPGRLVTSATGARIPKPIIRALERSGIDPADARSMVDNLGPSARLIDIDDNLQLLGAAQANVMGPARTNIMQEMRMRAAGGNERIRSALTNELGAPPNPTTLKQQITAAQEMLGPVYERELALGEMAVNLTPLRDSLNNQMMQAKGNSVRALNAVTRMLYRNDDNRTLETAPAALLRARNAIDGMISTETDDVVVRSLTRARQQVDDMLGNAVPGIKAVDAQYAELASQSGAIDTGARILNNGPEATTPQDLGDILTTLAGPQGTMVGPRAQPSLGPLRLSQGTRAMLDRVVGTNANDRVKLRQLIAGEGSWNHQKLTQVFGQERADNLMRILSQEARMAESENLVLHGSRTAPLTAAQQDLGLTGSSPGVMQQALNLKPGDAAARALDRIFGGMLERRRQTISAQTAEALMGRGDFGVRGRMNALQGPPMTPLPLIQQQAPIGQERSLPSIPPPRVRLSL